MFFQIYSENLAMTSNMTSKMLRSILLSRRDVGVLNVVTIFECRWQNFDVAYNFWME